MKSLQTIRFDGLETSFDHAVGVTSFVAVLKKTLLSRFPGKGTVFFIVSNLQSMESLEIGCVYKSQCPNLGENFKVTSLAEKIV